MLQAYVSSVFRCFVCMFQVFHADVAKVNRDVAYVAVIIHICCKVYVPNVSFVFQHMLQVCLSVCCICFTHMMQVFYLDVSYVCNRFFKCFHVFLHVFMRMFRMYVALVFIWMFQK
jgi:hypothetical protein